MVRQTAGPGAVRQATLTNAPTRLQLTLVKAKSFSLGIHLQTEDGSRVDITDCVITLTARNALHKGYTVVLNVDAVLTDPTFGEAQLNLQAFHTDLPQGEYTFDLILLSSEGYISTLTQGILEIVPSTEEQGLGFEYSTPTTDDTLLLSITQDNRVTFRIGKVSALELDVGGVTKLLPSAEPYVNLTGSYPRQLLHFGIPAGADSTVPGPQGDPGPQGLPGAPGQKGIDLVTYSGNLAAARPAVTLVYWYGFPSRPTFSLDTDLWLE